MGSSAVVHRSRRAVLGTFASVLAIVALALAPAAVVAHVNRTVGPYTFLVVLVEEPYFTTNHAGFLFWVHKGDTPVAGLDRTLRAQAIGHGRTVDLQVSPWNGDQLYTVDHGPDGQAFDPLGGGDWSLRLTGTIEGTSIDESFAVQFPAYPRVGTVKNDAAGAGAGAAAAAGGELVPPYLVVLLLGIGAAVAFRALRRKRVDLASLARSSELDGQALEPSIGRRL
jgi:hypothetical protein